MGTFTKPLVVQDGEGKGPFAQPVRLINDDGTRYAGGSVTPAASVPDLASNATLQQTIAAYNSLLQALRDAGLMAPKS